jgi:hypothetical protein
MRFFKNLFSRPTPVTPGSEVIKETPVDRFNVEIIENSTLDDFNERIKNSNTNLDVDETNPAKDEINDKLINILTFYDMMRKTCDKKSEKYKPVYFNFQCDGENVGGCAIWIMDLDETRKFAYFYGLHKFPQYFDNRDNFSSHMLLRSVISYCDSNNIEFICLPRPCMIKTTILWYSIGMTFDIANDTGNYLSYLKREPPQASNLTNHRSTITADLLEVSKKVKAINMSITNNISLPFSAYAIWQGGILYKDNYKKAISICDKHQQKHQKGGKKQKTKNKRQRQKTKDKRQRR